MAIILFRLKPSTGHNNPVLKLAIELQKRNTVYFIGNDIDTIYLTLNYYNLKYINIPSVLNISGENPVLSDLNWLAKYYLRFNSLRQFVLYKKSYEKIFEVIKPDLILLDEGLVFELCLLQPRVHRIVVLNTQVRIDRSIFFPSKNSEIIPTKSLLVKFQIGVGKFLWNIHQMSKKFGITLAALVGLRVDFILKFYASRKSDLKQVYLIPKQFEFPFSQNKNELYLGFQILPGRVEFNHKQQQEDDACVKSILREKKNRKVIYCCFGTLAIYQNKKYLEALKGMLTVFSSRKDYLFVVSDGFIESLVDQKFDNILIFKRVPQLEVLTVSDMMITHGGLNTVMECIYFEVPMFVLPLNKDRDQWGNSSRVLFHKIGERANFSKTPALTIAEQILAMCSNLDSYEESIKLFREKLSQEKFDITVFEEFAFGK